MSIAPPPLPTSSPLPAPPPAEDLNQALTRALEAAKLKRINEAIGICKDVLLAEPERPGALGLLGGILGQEGRVDEAIPLLERAVALRAGIASWHLNLCALYRSKNKLDEAIKHGSAAVRLSPDSANSHVEVALTYLTRGERDLALKHFRDGIAIEPELAAPHMGLGELLLSMGEYGPGWLEYAWRNRLDQARGILPKMVAAPWNGMRMPKGRILVIADQGFGDMIQFARYLPMVRERVGHLILGWGHEVKTLLGKHPCVDLCIENWTKAPKHDAYVLLSSLPQLFQTELDSIPLDMPYLSIDPERIALWKERLDAAMKPGRLRVGIAWSGRATHPNNARRSLRLAALAPILANPGVDFVTLQKPVPEEDQGFAASVPNLLDISPELTQFSETGAVISNLDLVLSVDTAVVHLAGALGKPTWVLVPEPADWRWLLNRDDSPWYPSLRLFRQTAPAQWTPVIQRAAEALRAEAIGQRIARQS